MAAFDIKVGSKLSMSFGIIGLFFAGVVGLYVSTLSDIQHSFEHLLHVTESKRL
ncbi:MAG: hypothetical protein HQL50_15540, partial [Magnetococcales bacterium]|nr:hypothetical protein [Magnetococcales bacterium]